MFPLDGNDSGSSTAVADPRAAAASKVASVVQALSDATATPLSAAQRDAVTSLLADAVETWPDVVVAPPAFAQALLRAGIDANRDVSEWPTIHASDLYLTSACVAGDGGAQDVLMQRYLSKTAAFLSGLNPSRAFVDDVTQIAAEKLLVGTAGRPPVIQRYQGTGPLLGFLRTTTVRIAAALNRAAAKQQGPGTERFAAVAADSDPELSSIRQMHADVFRDALTTTIESLDKQDATLLRMHFVQDLQTPELARMFSTSRWSIRRRLNRILEQLRDGLRQQVRMQLDASGPEVESLLRLYTGQMDVSIRRLLHKP